MNKFAILRKALLGGIALASRVVPEIQYYPVGSFDVQGHQESCTYSTCTHNNSEQWTSSTPDVRGTEMTVLTTRVSSFQGDKEVSTVAMANCIESFGSSGMCPY